MSFTRGTLFVRESHIFLEQQRILKNWNDTRTKVVNENLIQARTLRSLKNVSSEIISRLKLLGENEQNWILSASPREQAYYLWIAVCRRYEFIRDFAKEILREKYLTLYTEISAEDYEKFFNRKAEWHPELDKLSETTKKKLRQVVFKMMREAELITKDHSIIPTILPAALIKMVIESSHVEDLHSFPTFDSDLKI